jgi:hypothetical protein
LRHDCPRGLVAQGPQLYFLLRRRRRRRRREAEVYSKSKKR